MSTRSCRKYESEYLDSMSIVAAYVKVSTNVSDNEEEHMISVFKSMSGNSHCHFYVVDKECLHTVPMWKKSYSLLTV